MTARYRQLAEKVVDDIQEQRLKLGQRMPSVRQFASQQAVSITTALKCYHALEEQGMLVAKPQSGFYVSQPISQFDTVPLARFNSRVSRLAPVIHTISVPEEHQDFQPLAIAHLSPELLPVELLQRSLSRANRIYGHQFHRYGSCAGIAPLRQALCGHFHQQGFSFPADQLIMTNGCLDAVRTALEVVSSRGDTIAISSPCFSGLLQLLSNMGRKVLEIPCCHDGLDLEQLEKHMQLRTIKACLLTANHQNPTGISLSVLQKQRLANMAEQYQVPLIEDDIYLELQHRGDLPLPVKHWDQSGNVLWCGSISKSLSPGYRAGWCLPGRFYQNYLQQRQVQTLGLNQPIQYALLEFIGSGQYLRHTRKLRFNLGRQVQDYREFLSRHLPSNARISTPGGGVVLWGQLSGLNASLLTQQAAAEGIYIRPGEIFTSLGLYQDYFRINAGWPLSEEIKRQLRRLCQLAEQQLKVKA